MVFVGLILNLKIVHTIAITHIKPVHGSEDMFPPLIQISRGSRRVRRPGRMLLIIPVPLDPVSHAYVRIVTHSRAFARSLASGELISQE